MVSFICSPSLGWVTRNNQLLTVHTIVHGCCLLYRMLINFASGHFLSPAILLITLWRQWPCYYPSLAVPNTVIYLDYWWPIKMIFSRSNLLEFFWIRTYDDSNLERALYNPAVLNYTVILWGRLRIISFGKMIEPVRTISADVLT